MASHEGDYNDEDTTQEKGNRDRKIQLENIETVRTDAIIGTRRTTVTLPVAEA